MEKRKEEENMASIERGSCNDCGIFDASNRPRGGEMCVNIISRYGRRQRFKFTLRPDGSIRARAAGIASESVEVCPKRLMRTVTLTREL